MHFCCFLFLHKLKENVIQNFVLLLGESPPEGQVLYIVTVDSAT